MFIADLNLPTQFKTFQDDKIHLSNFVIFTLPDEPFYVFDPIFELIESKIP